MKRIVLYLKMISLIAIIHSCNDSNSGSEIPTCIEDKISSIKNNTVQNPPTQVWEWKTDHKTYYYITSDCCDQFNYLYDKSCSIICAPDGGLTGSGDGNCPDFSSQIVKTLIWEDPRK